MNRNAIDTVASALSEGPGYVVLPDILPWQDLLEDFESRRGQFQRAGVGRGADFLVDDGVRRDETLWFDPQSLSAAQLNLWNRLTELRQGLNERLFLGLWDFEGHYAFYPPGGFYEKHVDRFHSSNARTVSLIFYLNESWEPGDGGELLIYAGNKVVEKVPPRAGTLVCFLSDSVEHEVAYSVKERRSFAGWMRTRP